MERNEPCEIGRALGAELGRLFDKAFAQAKARFPDHAEPCASCAFRAGTFPNGCAETAMDALTCVVTGDPFWCHHDMKDGKPTKLCVGWIVSQAGVDLPEETKAVLRNWREIGSSFNGPPPDRDMKV